jgi:putative hydrolase of the HAD superfamily
MEVIMSSPETAIRSILFDFGGVLAEEGFREGLMEIARRHDLDPEEFFRLGGEAVYDSGYVTGEGSEADFWAIMIRRGGLPAYDPSCTDIILRRFLLRPRMLTAVQTLRQRGCIVAILSDQTDWLDRLNARDHFFDSFDHAYNSYHLGKGKRDPSIFTDVVRDLGVKPAEALSIDDNSCHVERALSRGLQAFVFTSERECLEELNRRVGLEMPL